MKSVQTLVQPDAGGPDRKRIRRLPGPARDSNAADILARPGVGERLFSRDHIACIRKHGRFELGDWDHEALAIGVIHRKCTIRELNGAAMDLSVDRLDGIARAANWPSKTIKSGAP